MLKRIFFHPIMPGGKKPLHLIHAPFTQDPIGMLAGVDTPESGSKEFQFLPAQAAAGTQRHIEAVGSPFNELSEFI
ncbi:MAG: hypothetical protein E7336_09785 [Clostridiales bacterium]|nr:hypothetical protein [Clostridiales bacterium]